MNNLETHPDFLEIKPYDKNPRNQAILYTDNIKENSLIQLISKAQQQGFNCLDLSKRNINEFPSQLLDFTSLEYLYLEGNQLNQLPRDLFTRLVNLKWLDLRHNQLTSIPNHGLAEHTNLQYLLLSGNLLRTLPFELGKVKTLSALNLDGNPLDHPPMEIIKQGIKAIQQYLRDKLDADFELTLSDDDDDDQQQTPKFSPRKSKYFDIYRFETDDDDATLPDLPALRVQSCKQFERTIYSARCSPSPVQLQTHSGIKSAQVTRKTITKKNTDVQRSVYTTEEQALMHSKHRHVINNNQRQLLRPRSINKNQKSEKPIVSSSYLINQRYTRMINKDQLDFIKNLSSEYVRKEDEVRRTYDRQIHDHIRQITDKMLKRRLEARGSIFEERRQVKLEIHELRRLVSEGKQHRPPQIPTRAKTSIWNAKSSQKR